MANVVLIIEDHPHIRTALVLLTRQLGHEPIAVESVREGVEEKCLEHNPTHVLLNLNLPDGYGTTVLRHIRSKRLSPKVAIVSGTSDSGLLDEARSLNPDAVIQKSDFESLTKWLGS